MATFGKTTDGGSSSSSGATKTVVSQGTPSTTGTVVTGHARLSLSNYDPENDPPVGIRFAIYADDGDAPGDLLAISDATTLTETTATWKTFTFSGAQQITVTQGTPYWIGPLWDGSGSWSVLIWREGTIGADDVPAGRWEHEDFTWPDPWDPFDAGGVGGNARPLSGPIDAYVTYQDHDILRLYLTNRSADAATGGETMDFWSETPAGATAAPRLLGTAAAGELTERGEPEDSPSEDHLVLVQQFVSGPATTNGEIPEIDWTLVIAAYQSSDDADMRIALGAWIMDTEGGKRQELVGVGGGPEFPVGSDIDDAVAVGITTDFANLGGSVLPQSISAGERLVVEIGYRSFGDGVDTSEYTGTILYGGTATPDLEVNDTAPNLDRPSWLEIAVSPGLSFADPEATQGTAAADLGFTATATGDAITVLPRLVQTSGTTFSGTNALTLAATLPDPATAGNLLVFCIAGDKNLDPLTGPDDFDRPVFLRTGNVTLLIATKVAEGGEQEISATVTAGDNQGGSDVWVGEFEQDGTDPWVLIGQGQSSDNGENVTEKSSGTTGTLAIPGLAIAAWAVDSINTEGTASYSNGYTELANPSAGTGTCAGLWIATLRIDTPGGTTGSTITRSGDVTPDQMCGGVIVVGRGVLATTGTAAADLGFTATAVGAPIPNVTGAATAALGFTATATGTVLTPGRGAATAALGFTASATGRRIVSGAAAAALGFTAAGRSRLRRGTATATLGFTAAAAGDAKSGPQGTAEADLGFTAAAVGTREVVAGVPFLVDELGDTARLRVDIAWGADPAGDPADWTWTDITRDVYAEPGITTRMGRDDEASTSQPAECTLVLRNDHDAYSLGGHSPNWPNVRRNVPIRVRLRPAGSGYFTVFTGFVDGFTPGWATTGRIPTVEVSASGAMRRLLQGDAPVTSAYRRAMTALNSVVAYWPFEDGKNSAFAAPVRGGSNMVTATDSHEFAAGSDFDCSAPLVRLRSSPSGTFEDFGASVDPYVVTGETQVRFLMSFPRNGLPNGAFLADIFTTGSAARWSLTYWDGLELDPGDFLDPEVRDPIPGGELHGVHLTIWDDGNNVIEENLMLPLPILGVSVRLSVDLIQEGNDVRWRVGMLEPGADFALFHEDVLDDETVGRVESIFIGGNDVDDVVMGHVTLQNEVTNLFEAADPLSAHTGEFSTTSDGRFNRLTRENGVRMSVFGFGSVSDNETLGPQLARPLIDLLRECEVTDQGQLYDGIRSGLIYTTRRYREQGVVALTIDAANGELAEPFAPIDDDQRTRNRVQATITTGVTAEFEDRLGPRGTDEIGIYDDSVEVNNEHDNMAIHYAAWLVHVGTHPGYRVGSVTVDLRAAPHLAADVLNAVPGEVIEVWNLDQVVDGWLPGDVPLSLIIEGVSHEIGPRHWRATFRCSPASPWLVGQAADDEGDDNEHVLRLDTDGTRLVGDHPAGSTTLTVSTDPFELAADEFDRTVSNGWGTADVGGAWTIAGTAGAQASDFSVGSGTAQIAVSATNRAQYAYLEDVDERDVDVAVTCSCSTSNISGGQIELADVMVRGRSAGDYTYARVVVLADESVFLSIVEVVDDDHNELLQPILVPGLTFTGTLRCRMQAEGHTLRARVWDPSDPEPDEWQREVTVRAARTGWVGARVAIGDGVSNTLPLTFSHDDFTATTLRPAGGPLWSTDTDDYPMRLSVGGIPVVVTACSGSSNPQTFTLDEPLPLARPDRAPVALWDPRPIGL